MTTGFRDFTTASEVKRGITVILRSEAQTPQCNPFATLVVENIEGETYTLARPYTMLFKSERRDDVRTKTEAETIKIESFNRFREAVVAYTKPSGEFYSLFYYTQWEE